jgi:CDGSH-type Zn-finger protein
LKFVQTSADNRVDLIVNLTQLTSIEPPCSTTATTRLQKSCAVSGSTPWETQMPTAIVTPINDGPYRIQGEFRIATQGGKPIEVSKDEVWLCRCGHSNNKPFCDGSHKKAGFASNLDEKPQEG